MTNVFGGGGGSTPYTEEELAAIRNGQVYASEYEETSDYYVDEDGNIRYTGADQERNPFSFDKPSGTDFRFQIGISKFNVPPTFIDVTEIYSNTAAAYPIRSKTSSKMSVGQRQKRITIRLMFPNLDSAWEGPNSLRGLLAQFRAAPFLPVYNTYLNDVHNVDAIALASLSVSTVEGMPFTMSAELVCYKFDWKPYVPYPGTFGGKYGSNKKEELGVFKWDDFQYYYDRSRKALDAYTRNPRDEANNSTATSYDDPDNADGVDTGFTDWNIQDLPQYSDAFEDALEDKFGPQPFPNDNTHRMEIYYSDREYASLLWLNRLGPVKVPDFDAMRKEITDWKALGKQLIELSLLKWFFNEEEPDPLKTGEQTLESIIGSTPNELKTQYNAFTALASLGAYLIANSEPESRQDLINKVVVKQNELLKKRPAMSPEMAEQLAMYLVVQDIDKLDMMLTDPVLQKAFRNTAVKWVHEWEIPMKRMGLTNEDLWSTVIVDSITCSTQNAIVALPLEGRVDPTFQYLGGMGTRANVTMTVIGERAIKHMREVFDAICTSSSSNRDAGVTGFLGLKNDLISVMGMKYALLDSWSVETIEGYPHVYRVTLNLSDFDILQQKREMPSASERLQMMEDSTVGHPILRMHQILSKTNAYPDLPLPRMMRPVQKLVKKSKNGDPLFEGLSVEWEKDEDGKVVMVPSAYLNPDFYFRRPTLDLTANVETTDDGGKKAYSPVPKFSEYGVVNMTPKGNDWTTPFELRMLETGKDPYNVFIKGKPIGDASTPIEDDRTNNPQSETNRQMTAQVLKTLEEFGIDPFDTPENAMGGDSIFSVAYDNKGDAANQIPEDEINRLERLYGNSTTDNFRKMIQEDVDGAVHGMIRAFPTYMVYLIDEGGRLITYKLFDTFYGIQSLISADIMIDKEAPLDTAVLQFSNLYNKLSTPQWFNNYSMPVFLQNIYTTGWSARQRVFGLVNEMECVQITPGMRIQIRMGYSANPEALPIVFNGSITEVTQGSVMTVVVQGDGVELAQITGQNYKSNASTYSFLGVPGVEPQDLICRYLGAAGSVWAQYTRRASLGMNPGDGSNGLAHFGAILWDTGLFGGDQAMLAHIDQLRTRISSRFKQRADTIGAWFESQKSTDPTTEKSKSVGGERWYNALGASLGFFSSNSKDILEQGLEDIYKLTEDFEIYKRNVYPGNGHGYRRFTPGTSYHNSWMKTTGTAIWGLMSPTYIDRISQITGNDTDSGPLQERTFKVNTAGKTNWEIFKMCEALLPNYVLAVRPFNHRSTLFYGKQNWLYTSGVLPLFDADTLRGETLKIKPPTAMDFRPRSVTSADYNGILPGDSFWVGNSAVWLSQEYYAFASNYLANTEIYSSWYSLVDSGQKETDFYNSWAEFLWWLKADPILKDVTMLLLAQDPGHNPLYTLVDERITNKTMDPYTNTPTGAAEIDYQLLFAALCADPAHPYDPNLLREADSTKITIVGRWNDQYPKPSTVGEARPLYNELKNLVVARENDKNMKNTASNFKEIIDFSDGAITSPPPWADAVPLKAGSKPATWIKLLFNVWMTRGSITDPSQTAGWDANDRKQNLALTSDEIIKKQFIDEIQAHLWDHFVSDVNTLGSATEKDNAEKAKRYDWKTLGSVDSAVVSGGGGNAVSVDTSGDNPYAFVKELARRGHPHVVDIEHVEEMLEYLGTGKLPPTYDLDPPETSTETNDGSLEAGQNENEKGAIAHLASMIAGGIDSFLDASYYNQSFAMSQYECLQDSAYYGMTSGTDRDLYAGHELIKKGYKDPLDVGYGEFQNRQNVYKNMKIIPDDVLQLRRMQIACDNPFSREFAEPVLEIREPFSRFHYATTERNVISNGIYKDDTNVANQIRAIAHTTSGNNAKREAVVKADASIPAHQIREKIVDTGLNYEFFDLNDLEDHKNMARKALKDSLQTMYGGELIVAGDPMMRPFDFLYLWDTPNKMNGWCEINRVTHHIGIDTGFTTSLAVAPIVVVDDAYLFGIFSCYSALQMDRISKELIATNVAYGQFSTDGVESNFESNTIQQVVQKSLALVDGNAGSYRTQYLVGQLIPAQAAMMKIDEAKRYADKYAQKANDTSWNDKWSGVFANFLAKELYRENNVIVTKDAVTRLIKAAQSWAKKAVDADDVENLRSYSDQMEIAVILNITEDNDTLRTALYALTLSAASEYVEIYKAKKKVDEINKFIEKASGSGGTGVVEDVQLENMETDQFSASQNYLATMLEVVQPGVGTTFIAAGVSIQTISAAIGLTGTFSAAAGGAAAAGTAAAAAETGAAATAGAVAAGAATAGAAAAAAAWAVALVGLAGFALYGIGVGINKLVTYLAEQEPISIVLLNQEGNPFSAGLGGADGIIAGQPSTLPILSRFGVALPPDDPATIWNQMGFSLDDGYDLRVAETRIKTQMMQRRLLGANRLEAGAVEGLGTNVVHECYVKSGSIHDGDTFDIEPAYKGHSTVRMRYIDAPEVDPKPAKRFEEGYEGISSTPSQRGAEFARDWLAKRLTSNTDKGDYKSRFSTKTKIKLVINTLQETDGYGRVLGVVIAQDSPHFGNNAYLTRFDFDWINESVNGEMLSKPEIREWVTPFIVFPGLSQVNGNEANVGDATGIYYNIQVTEEVDET